MIEFVLRGFDTAICGNYKVKCNKSPTSKLARLMIADGVSPDTMVTVYRGGTKCFTPASLGWWANRTVIEGVNVSARFAPYVPFPVSAVRA